MMHIHVHVIVHAHVYSETLNLWLCVHLLSRSMYL